MALNEEEAMGSSTVNSDPADLSKADHPIPTALPTPLATQIPHAIGYELQQFVRLAGAQCRMSADEIAYHNREHDRSRRPR